MAAKDFKKKNILGNLSLIQEMAEEDLSVNAKVEEKINTEMKGYIGDKEKSTLSIDLLDAAPEEWNFFPALEVTKFQQLKMSIMNNGILTPVIVWKQPNGRYMILSGHNRVKANREILEEYKDLPHKYDYAQIPVIIYEHEDLNEYKAREIIIDTNYIQRGQFASEIRVLIVKERMDLMKTQTDEKGRRIEKLIEDLGIKKSAIYEDIQIGEKIIPEIRQLYFDRKLLRKAVLKFAHYMEDTQRMIYEKYKENLTNENVMKLKKNMRTNAEFDEIFNPSQKVKMKSIKVEVPEAYVEEFMQIYEQFINEKKDM